MFVSRVKRRGRSGANGAAPDFTQRTRGRGGTVRLPRLAKSVDGGRNQRHHGDSFLHQQLVDIGDQVVEREHDAFGKATKRVTIAHLIGSPGRPRPEEGEEKQHKFDEFCSFSFDTAKCADR